MADFRERNRLKSLHRYGILDTAAEPGFDEIAQVAALHLGAPISAVSFVDEDRQWFKASVGLGVSETPRSASFCAHAMVGDDVFVVPDATADDRFKANPLVTGDPAIRFYAGAPIRSPEGAPLGAVCVIDTRARPEGVTPAQSALLRMLAGQVETQLRLRQLLREQSMLTSRQAARNAAGDGREGALLDAFDMADVGWWDWDIAGDLVFANAEMAMAYGVPVEEAARGMPITRFLGGVHPEDLGFLRESIDDSLATGGRFREEYRVVGANGTLTWIAARGRCQHDEAGRPIRFAGVAIDITDRKLTEQRLRDADIGRELAMQAAQLGRFDHNPAQNRRYYDQRALDLFGLTMEEIQSQEEVIANQVHPDDREQITRALANAVDPGRQGPLKETFRITHARTGEERWLAVAGRSQFLNGVCIRFMGVFEDVTVEMNAERQRRLLTNELNHRIKNSLTVVAGIVDQSLRRTADPLVARDQIAGRIQALSRTHDILTTNNWSGAQIEDMAKGMARGLSLPVNRLELVGGPLRLGPNPALQLALVLNELATNAMKYGALSNDVGRVRFSWSVEGEGEAARLTLSWRERGGPPVTAPRRTGFGARLIGKPAADAFSGEVRMDYHPAGVEWTLTAPLADLAERGQASET
jgi:PAS domain S-box-containing protein